MLRIENLHAYYGKSHVLHGVNLEIGKGEIVALLGRNGSGRSTTAKAIMGLVDWEGTLNWKGEDLNGKKAYEIAHLGVGYVPESRDVFPNLTVHQNLMLGQKGSGKNSRWSFDDMYEMFPRLKERQHTEAGVMSGGEQQMLTLCRTLMGDPDLIIIDEPTEGLAPKIVELVGQYLQTLKARGIFSTRRKSSTRVSSAMPNIRKASTPFRMASEAGLKFRRISSMGSMGCLVRFGFQARASDALRTAAR